VVVQVTVPVRMPGHAVTSISILSLHKSDMRLLHLAAKLGPLIAEAAQDVAVAMAEEQAEYDDQQQASTTGVLLIICGVSLHGWGAVSKIAWCWQL